MNRKLGVILSYVLMIFEVLSALLLTPFIIRTIGQAEYGVYKLIIAIDSYLLLLDLGVGNSIVRYISKYIVENNKEKESQFLGIATIFYTVISILTIIIGIVLVCIFPKCFGKGLSIDEIELGQKLLSICILNTSITLGTVIYNNVLMAYEKFALSRISSMIQIIIKSALTFLMINLGFGSIALVTVSLICTLLIRGFFAFYVLFEMHIKPKFKGITKKMVKDVLLYSSFILIQMLATQLNRSLDQILIGSLVAGSSATLAVYAVGSQVDSYFQSIGSAFTNILMPGVVGLVENNGTDEEIQNEMQKIGRLIFILLGIILCGFAFFGKEFIVLWAGIENEDAYFVALLLMTANLFIYILSIGSQILWARNKFKEQSIIKLLIVLLNIVLTVFLINWKPLFGAVIGTFISLIIGDVFVMNIVFKKKLNLKLTKYYMRIFKGILPALIISSGIAIGCNIYLPMDGWVGLILKIFIMLFVYCICLLIFGFNKYEKSLIKSIFKINSK